MDDTFIQVKNLTKIINKRILLKNVNISIPNGSLTAIIGKNGAGKSTLIKCLTGLYKVDQGSIIVSGLEWNRKNEKTIKKMISYIPDTANFDYNLSVERNIIHHASLYGFSERRIRKKLNNLFEFFNLLERKNDAINHYSLGMQKKALIIRGLVTSPKILILDEPTSGLDLSAEEEFMKKLKELNKQGMTIILSTQSANIIDTFDTIICIENGMVKKRNDCYDKDNKLDL